jgi:hypothetical protein
VILQRTPSPTRSTPSAVWIVPTTSTSLHRNDQRSRRLPRRSSGFRIALEDVGGRGGQFIWRGILGLRLNSGPSTERVAGWKIADRGKDWIRLEASSWFLTVHLVSRVDDGHLSAGTFIRYDHPIAPLIWVPMSAVHPPFDARPPGSRRSACEPVIHKVASPRKHDPVASREGGH